MITKRNGYGQTECVGCKNKGKFALNWDSFLFTFNGEPYCLECLLEMLDNLNEENQDLLKNYNIDVRGLYICSRNDKTMRLDKKALEYLRSLEQKNYKLEKQYEKVLNDYCHLDAYNKTQQKEFIKYLEDEIRACELTCDLTFNHNKEMKVYKENLQKFKEITGVENDRD